MVTHGRIGAHHFGQKFGHSAGKKGAQNSNQIHGPTGDSRRYEAIVALSCARGQQTRVQRLL